MGEPELNIWPGTISPTESVKDSYRGRNERGKIMPLVITFFVLRITIAVGTRTGPMTLS